MIRSLFSGVTGLKQHQIKMDVLSNNIANVNTTAYKKDRAMFQDIFYETLRYGQGPTGNYPGFDPIQVGHGVTTASIDKMMEQGIIEQTGRQTDIAFEGAGFFSVVNFDGDQYYTRNGNLTINPNYDLVMGSTGFVLQGWTSKYDLETSAIKLEGTNEMPYSINLSPFVKMPGVKSSTIEYSCNLDSGSQERDIVFPLDTLVYTDDDGKEQQVQFLFKKIDANNWDWKAIDSTEGTVATGKIKVDENGEIVSSRVTPPGPGSTTNQPYFTYDPDGTARPADFTPSTSVGNVGNGVVDIEVEGTLIRDESYSIVFHDGPTGQRVNTFEIIGEYGSFGTGSFDKTTSPTLVGAPVTFAPKWTSEENSTLTIYDSTNSMREAVIEFEEDVEYSKNDVIRMINDELSAVGLRATASFEGDSLQIISSLEGSAYSLTIEPSIDNLLGFDVNTPSSSGVGASVPMVVGDPLDDILLPDYDSGTNLFTFSSPLDFEIEFTSKPDPEKVVLIHIPDEDPDSGDPLSYTLANIRQIIKTALDAEGIEADVSFEEARGLIIAGKHPGSGESIRVRGAEALGLIDSGVKVGSAATGSFEKDGITLTFEEGDIPWKAGDSINFTTIAATGQANNVNIHVPVPGSKNFSFSTEIEDQSYQINGSLTEGAKHSTGILVYDSVGREQNLITTWEHVNSGTREWKYTISYDPESQEIQEWLRRPENNVIDHNNPTAADLKRANDALIENRTGRIYFLENGRFDDARTNMPNIKLQPRGSEEVIISLDKTYVSQYGSPFTTKALFQDGYEMGMLEHIFFESNGIIRGVYTNGERQALGQIAVTTFMNPGGLEKLGGNLFQRTGNSGPPNITQAGLQSGTIKPASLELSNVDLAEEFTTMIITQRSFQANSRIITTSDEMLQEVISLKR